MEMIFLCGAGSWSRSGRLSWRGLRRRHWRGWERNWWSYVGADGQETTSHIIIIMIVPATVMYWCSYSCDSAAGAVPSGMMMEVRGRRRQQRCVPAVCVASALMTSELQTQWQQPQLKTDIINIIVIVPWFTLSSAPLFLWFSTSPSYQ